MTTTTRPLEPCTCGAGYAHANNCPNCAANIRLRDAGQPHGYVAARSGAPTDAERQAAIRREQLRQPHGLDEAIEWLLDRAPKYEAVLYSCDACGERAAADNADEIRALIEHSIFDHVAPAGLLFEKAPAVMVPQARLSQWLGRTR
jgi:hypothetical protein